MNILNNSFKLMSVALVSGCMAFTAAANAGDDRELAAAQSLANQMFKSMQTTGEQMQSTADADACAVVPPSKWVCTAYVKKADGTFDPIDTEDEKDQKKIKTKCVCIKDGQQKDSGEYPAGTGGFAFNACFLVELMLNKDPVPCPKPDKPTDKPKPAGGTDKPASGDTDK